MNNIRHRVKRQRTLKAIVRIYNNQKIAIKPGAIVLKAAVGYTFKTVKSFDIIGFYRSQYEKSKRWHPRRWKAYYTWLRKLKAGTLRQIPHLPKGVTINTNVSKIHTIDSGSEVSYISWKTIEDDNN